MDKLFKIGFFFLFIPFLILAGDLDEVIYLILLIILILNILYEKYYSNSTLLFFIGLLLLYGSYIFPHLTFLWGLWVYDCIQKKIWLSSLLPALIGFYHLSIDMALINLLVVFTCSFCGYIVWNVREKEKNLVKAYDEERKLRYKLENQKLDLIKSSGKIQELVEASERNRIARGIHDNIGHKIAGILLQLEVAEKFLEKDSSFSREALKKSRKKLSDTLDLLRETIYNLKPKEKAGIAHLKEIIEEFQYGKINFKYRGDFSKVPLNHFCILEMNLKEALTNIAKYSNAENIDIKLEAHPQFIRLYIKDDGVGCRGIQMNKGMGLSGMKDRIENIGGHLSISGKDGFLVVSILPLTSQLNQI